jgi:hypothetical protein
MQFFGVKRYLNAIFLVLNDALVRALGVKQCLNEIFCLNET